MPPMAKQRRNRERATELITVLDGMVDSLSPLPFPRASLPPLVSPPWCAFPRSTAVRASRRVTL